VPGLSSTIHDAQGTETFPIIKLDETITPTHCLRRDDQRQPGPAILTCTTDKTDVIVP
jgi:hypothetical protein